MASAQKGPRSVVEARDPAKGVDQVRLLAGTLKELAAVRGRGSGTTDCLRLCEPSPNRVLAQNDQNWQATVHGGHVVPDRRPGRLTMSGEAWAVRVSGKRLSLRISCFEFVSYFDIRISSFRYPIWPRGGQERAAKTVPAIPSRISRSESRSESPFSTSAPLRGLLITLGRKRAMFNPAAHMIQQHQHAQPAKAAHSNRASGSTAPVPSNCI